MSEDEVARRCQVLKMDAVTDTTGWRLLVPRGCSFAGRGHTWEEAFARAAEWRPDLPPVGVFQHGLFDRP